MKTYKREENVAENHFHNILRHFDILTNFRFTAIIPDRYGIYKMSHVLPSDLRLGILVN